jgi:zinc transporter ZupT
MTEAVLAFNVASVLMTLCGGIVPMIRSLISRAGLLRMFSLRSGLLLAVAFVDVLPEAWALSRSVAGWGALGAFALLFLADNYSMMDSCPEYLERCSVHILGTGTLAALFAHAFIDGFNLAMAFSAGALAGTAVGLALTLHKLADGFTLTSLLGKAGYSRRLTLAALGVISLATPLGSAVSLWKLPDLPARLTAGLLGFSAGSFIYIGAADILPRIHKSENRGDIVWFGLGLASISALRWIN